jgi:hypothetical protein
MEVGGAVMPLEVQRTLTKRGSRDAFATMQRTLISPADLRVPISDGTLLVATRVESGRVVERVAIPYPPDDEDPDAGVREPRRPKPAADGAAVVASDDGD